MKLLKYLLFLTIGCMTLVSCKDDDNNSDDPTTGGGSGHDSALVGYWTEEPSNEVFAYQFNANGTGTFYVTISDYGTSRESISWSTSSSTLTIIYEEDYTDKFTYSISNGVLTMRDEDGDVLRLYKVN